MKSAKSFHLFYRYYSIEFELLEVSGKTVLGVTYWQVACSALASFVT